MADTAIINFFLGFTAVSEECGVLLLRKSEQENYIISKTIYMLELS